MSQSTHPLGKVRRKWDVLSKPMNALKGLFGDRNRSKTLAETTFTESHQEGTLSELPSDSAAHARENDSSRDADLREVDVHADPVADSEADDGTGQQTRSDAAPANPLSGPGSGKGGGNANSENSGSATSPPPEPSHEWKDNVKQGLSIAGSFVQTLLKVLPDLAEPNPVKVAFSVAKVVINVKDSVKDTRDSATRGMLNASTKLALLEAVIHEGLPSSTKNAMLAFRTSLDKAFHDLAAIQKASRARRVLDYDALASEIKEIFKRIEDATDVFQVTMAVGIQKTAGNILDATKREALYRLRPSENADYQSVVLEQAIRREECAVGTRIGILKEIEDWANDAREDSPGVFWLTGQAGSGKTTIATTIATMFDGVTTSRHAVLGANFFCSRQFPETRNPIRIIPTLAYQLARKCPPFADALVVGDKFDAVAHAISKQLRSLFVTPWLQSESVRTNSAPYLIIIDALDELADDGSTNFLDSLFTLLNSVPLKGFKIFITSRSDPKIVNLISSFNARAEQWLQRVPLQEVSSDIAKYLKFHLPKLGDENLSKLETLADGLFIQAATTVRYLSPRSDIQQDEQIELLNELLQYTYRTPNGAEKSGSEFIIDILYQYILRDALSGSKGKQRQRRLSAIHMLLSTGERSSSTVVSALLGENGPTPETVQAVVDGLHAVLYVRDGLIFWYHASFPDFIFDSSRSNFTLTGEFYPFSCDEYLFQKQLRDLCFAELRNLKFNMCNIPSSFLLDNDHYDINLLLAYSVLNWSHHLPISGDPTSTLQEITAFLELRALFWIELMNLLKQADKCISILFRARRWVEQHDEANTDHLTGLQEVIDFTAEMDKWDFTRSTPHLYVSHLATWSKSSKVIPTWKANFQKLPALTSSDAHVPVMFTSGQANQILSSTAPKKVLSASESVAFLNGDRVVSGHRDGIVRVWNASSGKLLKKLRGHEDQVNSVVVAPETSWIVSGSDDQTVQVWDALNANLLHSLKGHESLVQAVGVSQDGRRIVSGSHDGMVIIWDLESGQWQSKPLTRHTDTVASVAVSSNGTYVVSGSWDHTACIWDALAGEVLHTLEGHTDEVNSVAISSDGAQVVSGSADKTVRLWSVLTGEQAFCMGGHRGAVWSVDISSDGKTIVSGGDDIIVRVWNSTTGQPLYVLHGHQETLYSVAFSGDGCHVVSGAYYDSIRVWDVSGSRKLVLIDATSRADAWISSVDPRCAQWRIQEDGWVVSTDSADERRLMWLDMRNVKVQDPSSISVISKKSYWSIDFSNAIEILGENWTNCYNPIE